MPVFSYEALGDNASAVRGLVVAATPREARDSLRAQGLTVEAVSAANRGCRNRCRPAFPRSPPSR